MEIRETEVLGSKRREVVPMYPSFPKPNREWRKRG
jgi:hypothetical protein